MSTQKLIRELQREFPGSYIEHTKGNHLRVRYGSVCMIVASSPSDEKRFMRNVRGEFRRQQARAVTRWRTA